MFHKKLSKNYFLEVKNELKMNTTQKLKQQQKLLFPLLLFLQTHRDIGHIVFFKRLIINGLKNYVSYVPMCLQLTQNRNIPF
jgi:hypothetical protein